MGQTSQVPQTIEQIAQNRVAKHLCREIGNGQAVVTLPELSGETALDPNTAEVVMERLEQTDRFSVHRCNGGEIRWIVRPNHARTDSTLTA